MEFYGNFVYEFVKWMNRIDFPFVNVQRPHFRASIQFAIVKDHSLWRREIIFRPF